MKKAMLMIFLVFISVIANQGFAMTPLEEFRAVEKAIAKQKANWVPAFHEVARLDQAAKLQLVGKTILPVMETEPRTHHWNEKNQALVLRSQHDWRDYNGYNWITSVKHQGGCGSCGAFASTAFVEALVRITQNNPFLDIDLSEQHLFSCGGGSCAQGWYMGNAFDYYVSSGVPDEACFPYSASDNNCYMTCPDWQDRVTKLDSWELLWQYSPDEQILKASILEHPIPCYMEVYQDFFQYSTGIYKYVYGNLAGGHFVLLVGWNDEDNCWICKNSWGENWGEQGFFRIQKGEVLIGTWAMNGYYTPPNTPTPTPSPTPDCVHDGDVTGDNSLTSGDSQQCFAIMLGVYIPTVTEACAADCNASGDVSAGDAQQIFSAALGMNTCAE